VRLGASAQTPPDALSILAADTAMMVRAAVALNSAAPEQADLILARDDDERIRALLAHKLAKLLPGLLNADRNRVQLRVLAVLGDLVADEAVRVRAAIADIVKDMPEAPRELILRLAHDSEVPVSEPVIRLSPLLTPADLLALLAAAPTTGTAAAIASRPGLDETVADAVAASADGLAIRALLANPAAAIREATLDALAARAADQPDWHAPLVRRPLLSAVAAAALAEFVATRLLGELASRGDLPRSLTEELRRRLNARLQHETPPAEPRRAGAPDMDAAMAAAQALAAANRLDEAALLAAVQRGEARMATALLAVATGVPVAAVDRAAKLRSAKALVSLVWRAGFSMTVAAPLEMLLARTPPHAVLRAGPAGAFPLAVDEMRWQIDFLTRMGR
jgi:uncharacterized protein (DUF2336 family)